MPATSEGPVAAIIGSRGLNTDRRAGNGDTASLCMGFACFFSFPSSQLLLHLAAYALARVFDSDDQDSIKALLLGQLAVEWSDGQSAVQALGWSCGFSAILDNFRVALVPHGLI